MPTFSYEVRQQSGQIETGTVEGDDQRLARAFLGAGEPLAAPARQRRLRLMAQPQPGQLDHRRAQARVAGL